MRTGRISPAPFAATVAGGGLVVLALFGLEGEAAAATPAIQPRAPVARSADPAAPRPSGPANPELDQSSSNVVARARMLECGHQWSNLKRAGTASGTWKDFSRGCLAQR